MFILIGRLRGSYFISEKGSNMGAN